MREDIIFQLPTHYLPKVALRLDYLLSTIKQACDEEHPIIHNSALQNLTEILQLIQKPELKSRFLQELMRIEHITNKTKELISTELYSRLYAQIQVLTHVVGRFGDGIQSVALLQSVRLSQSSSVNDCDMQSPQLLLWLESDPQLRKANLLFWLTALRPLQDTVNLYLSVLKYNAKFNWIQIVQGFYQCQLPKNSCQLILLRMDKTSDIYPQMQLGHHGLNLRLFETTSNKEVNETSAQFAMAICHI